MTKAVSFPQVWVHLLMDSMTVVVVLYEISGGSKIPPGYCSVPWQEVY